MQDYELMHFDLMDYAKILQEMMYEMFVYIVRVIQPKVCTRFGHKAVILS